MFTLAHLSDLHTTPLAGASPLAFLNKRFFGWISWNLRRGRIHRPEVVEALTEDLRHQGPDHVAITGDLTNVALEQEFIRAGSWLVRLGGPDWISLIPGNHDAYVSIDAERSWDHWAAYMRSDSDFPRTSTGDARAPAANDFPTLRVRESMAFVGVSSAIPTRLFRATGRVGTGQLRRLEALLRELGERDLCRILLIHHPPVDGAVSARRRLVDSAALRDVIRSVGVELVLHGHVHRTLWTQVEGPRGPIPVVGVRSASDIGHKETKRAQYHLYRIHGSTGSDTERHDRIQVEIRGYDPSRRCFVAEGERWL